MNIVTFGTKNYYTAQLPRIEQGFIELGHKIVESYDKSVNNSALGLIYANDPGGFQEAIEYKQKYGGILILNVLDRPWHCREIQEWTSKIKEQLSYADIVTSISDYVKNDIMNNMGVYSKVIYQPIKPVSNLNLSRDFFAMAAGRLLDPNKRFNFIQSIISGFSDASKIPSYNLLNTFGSENPQFGSHWGIVEDEQLNFAYNKHKFCLIMSVNEGLCLPMIESIVAGCIPIVCSDMTTAKEFLPDDFIFEPDCSIICHRMINIIKEYDKYSNLLKPYADKYKDMFSPVSVANNILNLI